MLGNIRSGGWCPTERKNMICPKCGSKDIRPLINCDGTAMDMMCRCGKIIYPPNFTPVGLKRELTESRANFRGTCDNCGRENLCLNGGLCSVCRKAVSPRQGRSIIRGSEEWDARLRVVKEKLNPEMRGEQW